MFVEFFRLEQHPVPRGSEKVTMTDVGQDPPGRDSVLEWCLLDVFKVIRDMGLNIDLIGPGKAGYACVPWIIVACRSLVARAVAKAQGLPSPVLYRKNMTPDSSQSTFARRACVVCDHRAMPAAWSESALRAQRQVAKPR